MTSMALPGFGKRSSLAALSVAASGVLSSWAKIAGKQFSIWLERRNSKNWEQADLSGQQCSACLVEFPDGEEGVHGGAAFSLALELAEEEVLSECPIFAKKESFSILTPLLC